MNKLNERKEKRLRFYETTFFCDRNYELKAYVDVDQGADVDSSPLWPITLRINTSSEKFFHPSIVFFLSNKQQLTSLRDSLTLILKEFKETADD